MGALWSDGCRRDVAGWHPAQKVAPVRAVFGRWGGDSCWFSLAGVNPDDTYNETPYEKGYCFVSYLAHLVGDQSKFDAFLQVSVRRYQRELPSCAKPHVGSQSRAECWGGWEQAGERRWETEMLTGAVR